MQLNVIDRPDNWPRGTADGAVHSVFARVLNLSFGAQDQLSLDARPDAGTLPGTARVTGPRAMDFRTLVAPGAAVSLRAGILRIHGSALAADFREVPISQATPLPASATSDLVDDDAWWKAWTIFVATAPRAGFAIAVVPDFSGGRLDTAIVRRVRAAIPPLLRAVRAGDDARSRDCLVSLIGIGPGLTPSGDDFAAGFLLGLEFGPAARRATSKALSLALAGSSRASTDISGHYLAHAAAGRFASAPVRLAHSIARHSGDIGDRLHDAMQSGACSGSDTAFGILCGMATTSAQSTRIVVDALHDTGSGKGAQT